jgi:hypothetical protein
MYASTSWLHAGLVVPLLSVMMLLRPLPAACCLSLLLPLSVLLLLVLLQSQLRLLSARAAKCRGP